MTDHTASPADRCTFGLWPVRHHPGHHHSGQFSADARASPGT
jgi:hypothetical protein